MSTSNTISGSTTGANGTLTACITDYSRSQPYPYFSVGYNSTTYEHFDVQIRKVENGWVVKSKGKEYVITEATQIVAILEGK